MTTLNPYYTFVTYKSSVSLKKAGGFTMSLLSAVFRKIAKLPLPETTNILVEYDLKIPMSDGTILLADRYSPRNIENPPLILVRSCYGRRGFFGITKGRVFAEYGFQVVLQSTRGTYGSEGKISPFNEHDDGVDTITWLKKQLWYPGSFLMSGGSYLGFVQWALAREAGSDLIGMALQNTTSNFCDQHYQGKSFALDTTLSWTSKMAKQEQNNNKRQGDVSPNRKGLKELYNHLPLRDVDKMATGSHVSFFQEWLDNEPGSDFWKKRVFDNTIQDISAPVHMIGGWYDIFLPWQLRDYKLLRENGQRPYLTVGPWMHYSPALEQVGEILKWLKTASLGQPEKYRESPVRIYVTGANEWRNLSDWPPKDNTVAQRFHLQSGFGLANDLPVESEPDCYRYDPANPTPDLFGPSLSMKNSKPANNRLLEERDDVLVYSSTPLEKDLEIIGDVQADLYIKSSLEHTDFFVRLCDVDKQGVSINVCDALLRVRPNDPKPNSDGIIHITFNLWPTAHRFCKGHRLRVQVSSGAHPRYIRNTGTGESLGDAVKLLTADQSVYHDPSHPSAIVLPVIK